MSFSEKLALFRVLFPSWRFFENVGQVPRLEYSIQDSEQNPGPWIEPFNAAETRSLGALILNPRGNLKIAYRSLVDHLMNDINEFEGARPEVLSSQTSYRLILNLIRTHLQRTGLRVEGATGFRFRLTVSFPNVPQEPAEQMLLSPLHEI